MSQHSGWNARSHYGAQQVALAAGLLRAGRALAARSWACIDPCAHTAGHMWEGLPELGFLGLRGSRMRLRAQLEMRVSRDTFARRGCLRSLTDARYGPLDMRTVPLVARRRRPSTSTGSAVLGPVRGRRPASLMPFGMVEEQPTNEPPLPCDALHKVVVKRRLFFFKSSWALQTRRRGGTPLSSPPTAAPGESPGADSVSSAASRASSSSSHRRTWR